MLKKLRIGIGLCFLLVALVFIRKDELDVMQKASGELLAYIETKRGSKRAAV